MAARVPGVGRALDLHRRLSWRDRRGVRAPAGVHRRSRDRPRGLLRLLASRWCSGQCAARRRAVRAARDAPRALHGRGGGGLDSATAPAHRRDDAGADRSRAAARPQGRDRTQLRRRAGDRRQRAPAAAGQGVDAPDGGRVRPRAHRRRRRTRPGRASTLTLSPMSEPTEPMTALSTQLIHHDYEPPAGFGSMQTGVFKASTVIFPNVAALRARDWRNKNGYTYGLHGTPTTFTLEERIATLEGGTYCTLAPSGLSAIAVVDIGLLKKGDEVLLPDNAYGPSRELARSLLADWGIAHRLYDPMDLRAYEAAFSERTRLVWLEAPGSITMEFPDLSALVRIARQRSAWIAFDNTWGGGVALRPFDLGDGLGVDLCMQALTKYPSGGGDVLMGSVVTRDQVLHEKLLMVHMRLGI